MNDQITPSELKHLRTTHGVSQATLARDLEIQRGYISQFENGKYMFSDEDLERIEIYFEGMEVVNDGHTDHLAPVIRDGFLVPAMLGEQEAERLIEGIADSLAEYEEILSEEIPTGFFGVDNSELSARCLNAARVAYDIIMSIQALKGRPLEIAKENSIGSLYAGVDLVE